MAFTVLSVATPFATVGTDTAGAAEQVVGAIDAALQRAGHASVVVAGEGSAVAGTLVPLPRLHGLLDEAAQAAAHGRVAAAIAEAMDRHPVDIVHLHGADFAAYLPPPGVPVLVTLYGSLDRYAARSLLPARPDTHLHGVSAAQMRSAPPGLALLPPIEAGVPIDKLFIRVPKRRFTVGLGPIERGKGFHLALDAARSADMQLLLGGDLPRTPEHQRYFQEEIRPRLDTKRRYLGPIGFGRKRWMLGAARCLLAPSLTAEPCALEALEALACGTPVVAFPSGALADIVEPGVTGFLVNDVREMAEAIEAAESLDSEACRAAARARYSADGMAARYIALYEELAGGRARVAGVA